MYMEVNKKPRFMGYCMLSSMAMLTQHVVFMDLASFKFVITSVRIV